MGKQNTHPFPFPGAQTASPATTGSAVGLLGVRAISYVNCERRVTVPFRGGEHWDFVFSSEMKREGEEGAR